LTRFCWGGGKSLSTTPQSYDTAPGPPGEFALIARYFAPLSRNFAGAYGLRDDAAVISPAPGFELVAKTDAIIGGVDFPAEEPADLVARKALRVNLSDLAAKGAIPRAYMVDLMLPRTISEAWIAAFAAGLAQDQVEYGVHLIGGDMSATPGPLTIAVMAFGETPIGRIIRRGGARADDLVFVTGTIGDAAIGLGVLQGTLGDINTDQTAFVVGRYRLPQPRVRLGPQLIGIASAALDVSDGLVADLRHICEVSNLAAIVEAPSVPLSGAALAVLATHPELLSTMLTGGDDYEILFTAPPAAASAIAELSRSTGVRITQIGRMVTPAVAAEHKLCVLDAHGRPLALTSEGWTHF
jgi:thiamine-monophosphate kinase